jgi:hypothetical protein
VVKYLTVELLVALPDEATEDDALALVNRVTELAVARTEAEAYASIPLRPIGRLANWSMIHG